MSQEINRRMRGLRLAIVLGIAGEICGLPAKAAVGGLRAVERSNTQIAIEYVAPDSGPCRVEASESASYAPLVHDVDGTLFVGANLDTRPGSYNAAGDRVFIIGTRTVAQAGDGRLYSRALQQLTQHYIRVSCGAGFTDQATITATTGYPTFGRSVRDPMLADANHLPLWPDFSQSDRSEVVIEPMTGARIKHFGMPADALRIFNNTVLSTCKNVTSGWSIGGNCTGGSGNTTFTSSSCTTACGWLALSYNFTSVPSEALESNNPSINWLKTHLTGTCSGVNTTTADCKSQICWSWDQATCAGPIIDIDIPTSAGTVSFCDHTGSATCTIGDLMGADYRGIFTNALGAGWIYNSGSSTTVNFTDSGDCNQRRVGEIFSVSVAVATSDLTVATLSCGSSPPSITVTTPIDLSAHGAAAGYGFLYHNSWWRNPRWGVLIRKKSLTANNTITVGTPLFDIVLGGVSSNTSAGYNEPCSQFLDSNGFYKCRMTTKIYAYQPTTGEVRFLGQVFGNIGGSGWASNEECQQIGDGSTFWIDANSFVCINGNPDNTGKKRVFKVQFTGNTANDVQKLPDASMGEETSLVAGVTITDLSGDLVAAIHTFDSTFDTSAFTSVAIAGFSSGRYVHFIAELGSQDTFAWAGVFDMNTGLVIAAWQTYATPSASRWGVNHAVFSFAPENGANATANLVGTNLKQGRDDVPQGGRYHFTIPAGTDSTQTSFTVNTLTPVSPQPPTTLMSVAVNDVFVCDEGTGTEEAMQFTNVSSTTVTVTRHYQSTAHAHAANADCAMYPPLNVAAVPGDNSGEFWDFLTYPHGPDNAHLYASFCPGGGHAYYYSTNAAGSPSLAGNVVPGGIENNLGSAFPLCNPPSFTQAYDLPVFSGVGFAPFIQEGHPGFKPTPFPLVLDNHPNTGNGTQTDSALTRVGGSGTLFKFTYNENPFGASPLADGISYKYLPHLTTSRGRIFQDISGPGSVITGSLSDAWKRCIAFKVNECVSGSSVNDIYVNSPYMDPGYWTNAFGVTCWFFPGVLDDLCSTDDPQRGESVTAEVAPSTGATTTNPDRTIPILYQFGMVPKGAPNTSNTKIFWGNWGYGVYFPGGRSETYLVKLPDTPPPSDSVNREGFLAETVQIPAVPMGTSDVIVDFGYAEYGLTTDFYCTSRREKCMAVSATINQVVPFKFGVEGAGGVETGVAGVPCTVSCTVTVPVIPGYTVYFQIRYRDADHVTLATQKAAPRIVSNTSGSFQVR